MSWRMLQVVTKGDRKLRRREQLSIALQSTCFILCLPNYYYNNGFLYRGEAGDISTLKIGERALEAGMRLQTENHSSLLVYMHLIAGAHASLNRFDRARKYNKWICNDWAKETEDFTSGQFLPWTQWPSIKTSGHVVRITSMKGLICR